MILDKVEKNKAALLLGLTYLNRYYGVKFDDVNIKEIMLFKPDFYGKNVDVLDRLIEIGSKENYISVQEPTMLLVKFSPKVPFLVI